MKRITTRQLTICAVLTAMALALSYMERFLPLSLLVPLPGVKLGLANTVTMLTLYMFGPGSAVLILLARCTLGAMFAGNMSSLIFSAFGGAAAMLVMILLSRSTRPSVFGISIAGAAAHNCGQIAAACMVLDGLESLSYLPALLIIALFSGTLNGLLMSVLLRALKAAQIHKP